MKKKNLNLLQLTNLLDPKNLGCDGMLQHALDELLELQLLVLVLVASLEHLSHHGGQVHLYASNRLLKRHSHEIISSHLVIPNAESNSGL